MTSCSGSWTVRSTRPAALPGPARIVDASLVAAPRPAQQRRGEGRDQGGTGGRGDMARRGPPRRRGRTRTRAGHSSTARRSRCRTAGSRWTSPSRCSAASPTSASTGSTGSSGGRSPRTPPPIDGARLREGLVDAANTGSGAWADTACRSRRNEDWLEANGTASRIHRRKPRGRPMGRRNRQGQRAQIGGPGEGRACLRPPEEPHGAGGPHHRPRPRPGGHHDGEHGLQHEPGCAGSAVEGAPA